MPINDIEAKKYKAIFGIDPTGYEAPKEKSALQKYQESRYSALERHARGEATHDDTALLYRTGDLKDEKPKKLTPSQVLNQRVAEAQMAYGNGTATESQKQFLKRLGKLPKGNDPKPRSIADATLDFVGETNKAKNEANKVVKNATKGMIDLEEIDLATAGAKKTPEYKGALKTANAYGDSTRMAERYSKMGFTDFNAGLEYENAVKQTVQILPDLADKVYQELLTETGVDPESDHRFIMQNPIVKRAVTKRVEQILSEQYGVPMTLKRLKEDLNALTQ